MKLTETLDERPRRKIFYGWWIVLACAFLSLYTSGTFFYGFGAIFNPLVDEMGWSRGVTAGALSIQSVLGGLLAPLVGVLADRWSPRYMVMVGFSVAGLGIVLLSQIHSLPMLYLAFVIVSFGFSFSTFMVYTVIVANWFSRYRGRAFALLYTGNGLSGSLAPIMVSVVDSIGWRMALVWVGLGHLLLAIPFSLLLYRRPEDLGLHPDGIPNGAEASAPSRANPQDGSAQEPNLTLKEILRSRSFWFLILISNLVMLGASAYFSQGIPAMVSFGIERQTAGYIVMAMALFSLTGRWSIGYLADVGNKKAILVAMTVLQVIGLIFFGSITGLWQVVGFIVFFGIGFGGVILVQPAIQAEYFGLRAFGAASGVLMLFGALGGVAGPVLTGSAYDLVGSYRVAFLAFAVVSALALPFVFLLRKPPAGSRPAEPLPVGSQLEHP